MLLRRSPSFCAVAAALVAVASLSSSSSSSSFFVVRADESEDDNKKSGPSDHVSSKLMVHIPHSLFKDEGYDHREALFGFPPYGGSIAQNVYYADSKFCNSDDIDPTKGYPERADRAPWQSPYILMVDRGDCTFVQKVRNAQRTGAAGVLIADNTCLCQDDDCVSDPPVKCESAEPIMADDGSGADISIPSFLLFKKDADKIKDELRQNRPVQVEMKWSLPAPDNRVEYELWTTPSDKVSFEFLKSFKPVAVALGDRAYFTPHQYIYDGVKSHCKSNGGDNFCYTLCTSGGRYCALDPDNDLEKGISGADVVTESLRRLCIWNHYGAVDGIGETWWDYIAQFMERCNDPDYFANDDCIQDVYNHANVNGEVIEQCMKDSGDLTLDVSNNKLDAELTSQTKQGIVVIPTAVVNTAAIRGALTAANVLTAICAGYAEGSRPDVCDQCGGCPDVAGCAERGGVCPASSGGFLPSGSGNGGVSTRTFVNSLLFVVALFGAAGVWYYKRTKEDMREQVRGILAEYMPLEDQEAAAAQAQGVVNPMDFARGGTSTSLIS